MVTAQRAEVSVKVPLPERRRVVGVRAGGRFETHGSKGTYFQVFEPERFQRAG